MSNKDFQNGFALGLASGGVVEVINITEIDALEDLIDNSGVLEDTEGSVTQKVEELICKAEELEAFKCVKIINFQRLHTFPNRAVIDLPYITSLNSVFAYWNTAPIPIVEELTITAPSLDVSNRNNCMGNMFLYNLGVKKVVLNMPDECQYMYNTFKATDRMEEIVLNFSTKNIIEYESTFSNCRVEKIVGVLDFSSATNVKYMFNNCDSLKEVTFKPNTLSLSMSLANSSKLTSESIQSIIDGLATVETAETLTLPKAIVLTDEQKATINAKGWTLAQ